MHKTMTWASTDEARHAGGGARPLGATLLHLAAALLRGASAVLDRLAVGMTAARRDPFAGDLEFHALHRDAGAAEGALYVDGRFVGTIEGVHRL